jgi:hypothetical protein
MEIDSLYVTAITEDPCFHVSKWGCSKSCLLPIIINVPIVIDSAGERCFILVLVVAVSSGDWQTILQSRLSDWARDGPSR